MSRYRLVFVVSLLVIALWGIGAQALFGQSCEDLPLSTTNHVGVTADLGYPGDTVWATFSIDNDSVLAGFLLFIRFDQALITPLTSVEGDPLAQRVIDYVGGREDLEAGILGLGLHQATQPRLVFLPGLGEIGQQLDDGPLLGGNPTAALRVGRNGLSGRKEQSGA